VTGGSNQTVGFDHPGITFPAGVYVEKNAGTVVGMVEITARKDLERILAEDSSYEGVREQLAELAS
jgi:hypothetical protein